MCCSAELVQFVVGFCALSLVYTITEIEPCDFLGSREWEVELTVILKVMLVDEGLVGMQFCPFLVGYIFCLLLFIVPKTTPRGA